MGFCFDAYRALRYWLRWGPALTFVGDVAFSLGALSILFNLFLRANNLSFRFYVLWGSLLGLFFYLRVCSRTVIRLLLFILDTMRRVITRLGKLIAVPFHGLEYLMRAPYALLRWLSMLVFRLTEATIGWQIKSLGETMRTKWRQLFPPRTNG